MKLVVFGLAISSSWGNGHATLWRALCRALSERGHQVVFFERDQPYYAASRDWFEIPGGQLILYPDWHLVAPLAATHLKDADAGIVTSYCPDGLAASGLLFDSPALRVFYDLDTPVTLAALEARQRLSYIGERGLRDFDLALSFTGGRALEAMRERLGAPRAAALYGSVDARTHSPAPSAGAPPVDLSYLGTYAADRQAMLDMLFLEPARRTPKKRFLIGGSLYPDPFPWTANISFLRHVAPEQHPAFYGCSRLTLNVTRRAMAEMGFCPSGRLFEAAACGVPILSDGWTGIDQFFEPGREIVVASETGEALDALALSDAELSRIARAARERVLAEHTAEARAAELEELLQSVRRRDAVPVEA